MLAYADRMFGLNWTRSASNCLRFTSCSITMTIGVRTKHVKEWKLTKNWTDNGIKFYHVFSRQWMMLVFSIEIYICPLIIYDFVVVWWQRRYFFMCTTISRQRVWTTHGGYLARCAFKQVFKNIWRIQRMSSSFGAMCLSLIE